MDLLWLSLLSMLPLEIFMSFLVIDILVSCAGVLLGLWEAKGCPAVKWLVPISSLFTYYKSFWALFTYYIAYA